MIYTSKESQGPSKAGLVKQQDIPRVHLAQTELDDSVEGLLKGMSELENRLRPVLRQVPCADSCESKPEPVANTVADRIFSSTKTIRHIQEALKDILVRLEV